MPEANELIGGRYRLGPAIGSGGMGTVRRARDLRFDRDVAIKLLRTAEDPRHQERMRREARLLGALQHPNLVAAYDTGIDLGPSGPMQWLAMELVRGPDLGVLLRQRRRIGSEDVRRIVHDAASALVALHQAGIVHRDLKPANVLLTSEPGPSPWHVKLADLGIALAEDSAGLTTTGQVMGTAAYLSPEQVSGEDVDPASDVYSLGLIALEALTGEHAFPGGAVESATTRLVRPPAIPDWITGGWRMLLTAMTAIGPADRPTARQVHDATAAPLPELVPATPLPPAEVLVDEGEPTVPAAALDLTAVLPAATAVPPSPAHRRTLPIAAAALVLGLLGGGTVLLATAGDHPRARPSASAPAPTRTVAPVTRTTPTPTATPTAAAPTPPAKTATTSGNGSRKHPGKGKGHGKG